MMSDSLKLCLGRLRNLQKRFEEKALDETVTSSARAAYFDAETRLSRGLGELDYLLNLESGVERTGRNR